MEEKSVKHPSRVNLKTVCLWCDCSAIKMMAADSCAMEAGRAVLDSGVDKVICGPVCIESSCFCKKQNETGSCNSY